MSTSCLYRLQRSGVSLALMLILTLATVPAWAAELSKGQTLYVPAYSHIYIGHKGTPYMLAVTLSIRNIDPKSPLTLTAVDYHDTEGRLIKKNLTESVTLKPMASTRFVIPAPDKTGGSGANFIVKWSSKEKMNPPVVESIMIGTQSQQGISFTSRAEEIRQ